MLLTDGESNACVEVEIMLGATDPSHIVRCIEYWDIERRRYPAYDHVAVLVAEDITSRFLNVMSLLAGSIPLVAIQLTASLNVNSVTTGRWMTESRVEAGRSGSSGRWPCFFRG